MATKTAAQQAEENAKIFMEIGPRLSTRYGSYVVAIDPVNNKTLLGGLGGMGLGTMWIPSSERDKERPGFSEARRIDGLSEEG